jgi:hypothetical protein
VIGYDKFDTRDPGVYEIPRFLKEGAVNGSENHAGERPALKTTRAERNAEGCQ